MVWYGVTDLPCCIQDSQGRTALHAAAFSGNTKAVKMLIDAGWIQYNALHYNVTPCSQGLKVNEKDKNWWTPFHWACVGGNLVRKPPCHRHTIT